ncbi:MAG: thioesterase family protein [Candidatus Gottesmanbacteria bacterium]
MTEADESQPVPVDQTELTIEVENDQYGHVNYKAYPGLFEPGQDAYMSARGLSFDTIEAEHGFRSVVPTYTPKIHAEVFNGDRVNVETRIDRVGNSSFTFGQAMKRGGTHIADYSMVVVLIDGDGAPVSIPDPIRQKLQAASEAPALGEDSPIEL